MGFDIIIKPIVWFDIEDAMLWYERESNGLGKRFFNSFEITVEKIQLNPATYKKITPEVRRCLVKNFPYKIFYTITSDTIFILGVSHTKGSDTFVNRRLKLL